MDGEKLRRFNEGAAQIQARADARRQREQEALQRAQQVRPHPVAGSSRSTGTGQDVVAPILASAIDAATRGDKQGTRRAQQDAKAVLKAQQQAVNAAAQGDLRAAERAAQQARRVLSRYSRGRRR